MNLTRLVVLGLLMEHGPRHGHQLRRDVQVTQADQWAGIGAGALNRELRELERAGFISPVRTEQIGRRPPRTIYEITDEGRETLNNLRDQAIGRFLPTTDPVSVALIFSAPVTDQRIFAGLLAQHRQAVVDELSRLSRERQRGISEGFLDSVNSPSQAAAFRRTELQVAAEMQWHVECDPLFGGLPRESPLLEQSRFDRQLTSEEISHDI